MSFCPLEATHTDRIASDIQHMTKVLNSSDMILGVRTLRGIVGAGDATASRFRAAVNVCARSCVSPNIQSIVTNDLTVPQAEVLR